jgi:hypothetical protein
MSETVHAGFTALPAGWYNYYSADDDTIFRSACPGMIQIDTLQVDEYSGKKKVAYSEWHAATLDEGYLDQADTSKNYLYTSFGEYGSDWEQVKLP